jgi:hypothetical protein
MSKAMMDVASLSGVLRRTAAKQSGNDVLNLPKDFFKEFMQQADPRVLPIYEEAKVFG